MDNIEKNIINHYFKKYKNKQISNGGGIFDRHTFTRVRNNTQRGGTKSGIINRSFNPYDGNILSDHDYEEEYNRYIQEQEELEEKNKSLFYKIVDNDYFHIILGIILGFFIVRFFMPHAFGVHKTSAHYDYLGEGVANIVMKTKDQFLGDPRFPSENYVVRFNNPNLYLDHVVGHYDIQTLNNQTSIPWTVTHIPMPPSMVPPEAGKNHVMLQKLNPINKEYIEMDKKKFLMSLINILKLSLDKKVLINDWVDGTKTQKWTYVLVQDLHDSNIMIDDNGNLKITDLDYALAISDEQRDLILGLLDHLKNNINHAQNTDKVIKLYYDKFYRFFYKYFDPIIKNIVESDTKKSN